MQDAFNQFSKDTHDNHCDLTGEWYDGLKARVMWCASASARKRMCERVRMHCYVGLKCLLDWDGIGKVALLEPWADIPSTITW